MKVEIKPISETECLSLRHSGDSMVIEPSFRRSNAAAVVGSVTVRDANNKVVFTGVLRVNGKTGRASLVVQKRFERLIAEGRVAKGRK